MELCDLRAAAYSRRPYRIGGAAMTIARTLLSTLLLAWLAVAHASHHEAAALRAALDDPSRPEADRARDGGRKPADVIAFLGFADGMRVMDMIAAGGYYTEVLSLAVGGTGTVYAQNPPAVLKFRDGVNDKALTERLADDRLANVVRIDADFAELDLAPASLDGAITALNFHDVYNRDPDAAVGMLKIMKDLLVPGGVLGIIDHAGAAGADNAALHRIEKDRVIDAARAAGFEVVGDSDLLANPEDARAQMVFAPEIRGRTDRFLLKLQKPG